MSALVPLFQGDSGAAFSACRRYRYLLWRYWDRSKPMIAFCLLNPSTADEVKNDPTVERCQRRAIALGYGGVEIVNIFALRSTDPMALYSADDPVGPENDSNILSCLNGTAMFVCGWGTHGALHQRGRRVREMLRAHHPTKVHVLQLTKEGYPQHPLYIGYAVQPIEWF